MPVAFQIYATDEFPAQARFGTEVQLSLLADIDYNVEVTKTQVVRSESQPIEGLVRFDALHEFVFHLEYPGRARGKTFREFVAPYKFPLYLGDPTSSVGFRPLLVRTKKKVAADFVARLNGNVKEFAARPTAVDFAQLRPRLDLIRGAWFGAMRERNISSTGVFGHHVDQSDEFQHAETIGELRNLVVEFPLEGVPHTVMLSAGGALVLYNAYPTEVDELAVVLGAVSELLVGCLAPVEKR